MGDDNPSVALRSEGSSRRCTAHSSRTGLRCKRYASRGATVCTSHGARAPAVKRAAEARLAEAKARAAAARLGGRLDIDPGAALELVWQGAAADVVALEQMVAAMGPVGLASPAGVALTRMLDSSREVARRAAKAALDAGVDERRVRVSEATIARLVAAVVGALEDCADVLPMQALPMVRAAIARRLRAVGPALSPPA
jgi:hypothetical protein